MLLAPCLAQRVEAQPHAAPPAAAVSAEEKEAAPARDYSFANSQIVFGLLQDKHLATELGVSDSQGGRLAAIYNDLLKQRPTCDPSQSDRAEQVEAFRQRHREAIAAAHKELSAPQRQRLRQIYWQQIGPFGLVHDADLQKEIKATAPQIDDWKATEQAFEKQAMQLQSQLPENPAESQERLEEILAQLQESRSNAFKRILAGLTAEQRKRVDEAFGKAYHNPERGRPASLALEWWKES